MADLKTRSIAKVVDLLGEGTIILEDGLKNVYLNKTPIQNADGSYNFENVVCSFRSGTADQSLIEGFTDTENPVSVGVTLLHDTPITRTITNTDIDAVKLTFKIPSLVRQNSHGKLKGSTVAVTVEMQAAGGGYNTVYQRTFDGRSDGGFEFAVRVAVRGTSAPWDIRVTKTTDDSSISDQRDLIWETYSEIIDSHTIYPFSAVSAISYDSTQFSTIPATSYKARRVNIKVPKNYNLMSRFYEIDGPGTSGGYWDGTFKTGFTDNPAWLFYDIGPSKRFGAGRWIDASQIGKWELYKIAQYCDELVPDGRGGMEPRFRAFLYLQTAQEAYTVIQQLASIFRGITYYGGGAIIPAQDRPQEPVWQFTRANVIDGSFTYQGASRKAIHTVAYVKWIDPNNFYSQQTEYVEHPDPEMIQRYGIVALDVVAVACFSQGQAHRLGLHALITEQLESEAVSFSSGLEGVNVKPFDIVSIADPKKSGARLGGRILSGSLTSVVLDAPVTLSDGATYEVSIIMPDASPPVVTRTVSNVAGVTDFLQFDVPLDAVPSPAAVWTLSSDVVKPLLYRITARKQDQNKYQFSALRYAPEKYDLIEQNLQVSTPPTPDRQIPASVQNLELSENTTASTRFSGMETNVTVRWDVVLLATAYEIVYQLDQDNPVTVRTTYPTYVIDLGDAGHYAATVTAVRVLPDGTELRGQSVTVDGDIIGTDGVPDDISGLALTANADATLTLNWDEAPEVLVRYGGRIEIRTGSSWSSGAVVKTLPGDSTSTVIPAVNGTYRVRAVTANGATSPHDATVTYGGGGGSVPSKSDVIQSSTDAVAVGTPQVWPFDGDIPGKYLRMDGAEYDVDDYPDLGAKYGGIAGGTFNIADWTGVPVWGATADGQAGTVIGDDSRSLAHSHDAGSLAGTEGSVGGLQTGGAATAGDGSVSISGSTADALGDIDVKPRRAIGWWIQRALK